MSKPKKPKTKLKTFYRGYYLNSSGKISVTDYYDSIAVISNDQSGYYVLSGNNMLYKTPVLLKIESKKFRIPVE